MREFKSWRSYERFAEVIMKRARYVRDPDTESFLTAVLSTAMSVPYPKGTRFWRAQRGYDSINGRKVPYKKDRMKPLPESSREGRVNPKGIPVLHLATDRDTAIGEVRPWIEAYVSVGVFAICRPLKVVNCIPPSLVRDDWANKEPDAKECEKSVWNSINEALARPVDRERDEDGKVAEYAPTQIIAELFKAHSLDGILYQSRFGRGNNLALFDLNAAKLVKRDLFQVSDIMLRSRDVGRGYRTFRWELFSLYGNKCAVTGCDDWGTLEPTYIWPRVVLGLDRPDNGLLLRIDIQRLFNNGLLRIHPRTLTVHINSRLKDTAYWDLNGCLLRQRVDGKRPRREYLQERWDEAGTTEGW